MTYDLSISVAKVPVNRIAIWRVWICHIFFSINLERDEAKTVSSCKIIFTCTYIYLINTHIFTRILTRTHTLTHTRTRTLALTYTLLHTCTSRLTYLYYLHILACIYRIQLNTC